jgi:hypothetical protein
VIIAGASVQGTAHLATGQGCQDAFKAIDLGSAAVLAVSDGASSRDRSALGAHIAVDAACRLLAEDIPDAEDAEDAPEAWTRWIAGRGKRVVEEYLRAVSGVLAVSGVSGVLGTDTGPPGTGPPGTGPPGTGSPGTGPPGTGSPGTGSPGTGSPGTGSPGTALSGTALSGTALSGTGSPGTASSVTSSPGTALSRTASPDTGSGDPGALAATLTAAVVAPPWVAFVSVGDGFGTLLTRDDRCHLVLPPPTVPSPFLSSPGAALRIRTFVVWEPGLSGVVLATDGCAALALDHPSVHQLPPEAGPLPAERFFLGLAATLRENHGDAEPLRRRLSGPEAGRTGDDLTVLCALVEAEGA